MRNEALAKLGDVIRKRRENRDVSQEGFADAIGMHRAYYGRIERGFANLTLQTLAKVANGLEIPVSDLMKEAGW
jgi:transcriptional regulator with XRE-family HTH domain